MTAWAPHVRRVRLSGCVADDQNNNAMITNVIMRRIFDEEREIV